MSEKKGLDVGGQAVIEGVLMKNKEKLAIAVRLENGKIKLKKEKLKPLPKILRLPFIRGITTLVYIMIIGIKALVWSANQALGEEQELGVLELIGTLLFSLVFALLFFIGVPFSLTWVIGLNGFWFNVVEGVIRLAVFIGYVYVISFMKDIRRMFQYHGAEHMTVNCYEYENELTVDKVKKYSTIHPRCGTSFIMLVLIISIVLFTFIPSTMWWSKLVWRVALVPVVSGVGYELLRLGGKFRKSAVMGILIAPGMWVQKITTQKPSDDMVEVAIASLNAVVND